MNYTQCSLHESGCYYMYAPPQNEMELLYYMYYHLFP